MTCILDQPTDQLVNFRIPEYLHVKGLPEYLQVYPCLEMEELFSQTVSHASVSQEAKRLQSRAWVQLSSSPL